MTKAPGYQRAPHHKIREQRVDKKMRAVVNGDVVADSSDVVRVDEDGMPPRFYFPRADVRMDKLQPSDTTSVCPFKGTARYFSLNAGGKLLEDAIWSYEDPYEEHAGLKDRLAFYDDKLPEIEITVG